MKKGKEIELSIEKLAYGGKGIGRFDNQVIFVEGGVPGDKVRVKIRKIRNQYAEARIVDLIEGSPLRQPAACQHFGNCGGCKWQHLDYQQQLYFKREHVIESIEHIAGVKTGLVHPTLPSPLIFGYRNKMEFSFTGNRWLVPEELSDPDIKKEFGLGLHIPGSFDRVIHIQKCWLQDNTMNIILNFCQDYFKKSGLSIFHLKTHEGLLRFLVLRKSFASNNYMVNIVTFQKATELSGDFSKKLTKKFASVTSVINTVNPKFAQIAFGEEEYLLYGQRSLLEKIDNYEFEISANSFFQTNPMQAENLYKIVQKYVGTTNNMIWDLYTGTGIIALFLAQQSKNVIGFEIVSGAVKDAYENCRKNGITNCRFVEGDIRKNLAGFHDHPDVIVCDPPRSGMHPEVIEMMIKIRPPKIVYVSCNPTTMARDIKPLLHYYNLKEIQPVDMFPHTYHIESVAKLERK
jgi:23S rRNA (uracil1939-C5)-methyltransferase